MEGRPLIVERKRVPCPFDALAQDPVRKLKGPDPVADAARHLIHGQAVGRDRVPHADELYGWDVLADDLGVGLVALQEVQHRHQDVVAQGAEEHLDPQDRVVTLGPVGPVSLDRAVVQLRFGIRHDQALLKNKRTQDTHGERATAEAEEIDLRGVLVIVVAADELVGVEDVALEAVSECAAQHGERHEGRGTHAIVVFRGLAVAFQVERLEHPPDVRAPDA